MSDSNFYFCILKAKSATVENEIEYMSECVVNYIMLLKQVTAVCSFAYSMGLKIRPTYKEAVILRHHVSITQNVDLLEVIGFLPWRYSLYKTDVSRGHKTITYMIKKNVLFVCTSFSRTMPLMELELSCQFIFL